ncbi:uncharacterized protein TNCV_1969341 [Trichonephila clavipes]|nr:uncharacterized protein TNCV_1969341 [Trichonephila clavipes]
MDLPPPVSQKSYERILRKINLASREVADDSMKNAAKEEVSASGSNEIYVSGDGTRKTRGHTSRIGVCSVIGDVTGQVIDVAVLSSYCKGCEKCEMRNILSISAIGTQKPSQSFKEQHHILSKKGECVGRIQKRMGAGLRKLKTMNLIRRSTDDEPMHHFCPIGDTSWCKYQKAVATNSASLFKHKNIGPIAIMDEIKPIIAELSAPKLLKKCVGG